MKRTISKSRLLNRHLKGRRGPVTAAVAAFAVAVVGYFVVHQAFAASPLCETNGVFCVNAANLNHNTTVVESRSGRLVAFVSDGGTYKGYGTGHLVLTGASNRCLAEYAAHVRVGYCSHEDGISWARVSTGNSNYKFINRLKSEGEGGFSYYLSGLDCAGCGMRVSPPGINGYLYQFRFSQ